MTSLTQPDDYSVAELKDALEAIDDREELERLLEAEREGEDRVTATEAIEQRLEEVGDDDRTDEAAEAANDGADATGPGGDAADSEGADEDGSIEEGWSKNTTVHLGDPIVAESKAETYDGHAEGEESAEAATLDSLDLSAKQAEALSLSADASGVDGDVGRELLENLERIRHTFEDAADEGGRVEARIRQLQTEVGDLKSYTSALEEFLDEEGTGQQVIESVRADLETLDDDLSTLTDDVRTHARTLGEVWEVLGDVERELARLDETLAGQRDAIDEVADEVETVDAALESLRETTDDRHEDHTARFERVDETLGEHADDLSDLDDELDEGLDAVGQEIDIVGSRVDDVAGDLSDLDASVDERFDESDAEHAALSDRIDDNAAAIDDLNARLDEVAADVAALEDLVGDPGRVDERFEAVEEEIEALQGWREQLSSVILGSAGGQPPADE